MMMKILFKGFSLRSLIAVLALLPATITLTAVAQPPTLVVTDRITELEFHDQITLTGRTAAISTSSIVSEVSGRVKSINAREGTRVSKGDPLVTVDDEKIRLRYTAKRAEAAQAKAQSDLATANLKRAEKLYAQSGISESQFDEKRTQAVTALERYNQLQAEARQLKLDLDNFVIRAPYDGYTVKVRTQTGEWVNAGSPVFDMVNLSRVKVTVDLPEKYFSHVSVGSAVSIVVSQDENNPITGEVTGIAPKASQSTHTFPVYVTVDNSDGRLGAGMLVRVTLNLNKKFTSLAVSKDAIVRRGAMEQIYTIVEGKAAPVMVRSGSTSGNMVAIAGEGLAKDMVVVVRGNERIFPGAPVRTADAPPSGERIPERKVSEDDEHGGDS